ncbi:DUF779 domain-containing protein [Sphingobacterium sp. E70]|uniref:DUF779 domain-containing protein n=1 Tax=Sphingobacterium sp. E70 TaxID=2853439 RepID=UPI00211C94E3|nr:DUF779 domain-containing protein [Sphingobacterium sp. E70]
MNDAMIGLVEGYEFWVDRDLFEYWKHAHFTLDVLEGFGPVVFRWKHHLEKPLRYITGSLQTKN